MFDLPTSSPPRDAAELGGALEASVRRRIDLEPGRRVVTVEMDAWPHGRRLRVDLTGGRMDLPTGPAGLKRARRELKPPSIVTDRSPGPAFNEFEVCGEPVYVGPMTCTLRLEARDVRFDFGRDDDGTLVLSPAAGEGRLHAAVPKGELLEFIRRQATEAAAEKGVRLDDVEVDVTTPDDRTVSARGTMRGRKTLGFLSASFAIDFRARIEIDDALVGHIRELELHSQGMLVEALLALFRPKLAQIRAQPLELREVLGAFVPASLTLRSLAVEAGEEMVLRASFGPPEETS